MVGGRGGQAVGVAGGLHCYDCYCDDGASDDGATRV